MRISKAWLVATKDLKVFIRKKNVLYSIIYFPLIVAVALPILIHFVGARHGVSAANLNRHDFLVLYSKLYSTCLFA
jgi:ABC-type transport system involved in cytochrome c biogenesis permease component